MVTDVPCKTVVGSGGVRWLVQTKGIKTAEVVCLQTRGQKEEVGRVGFGFKTQN